MKYTQLLPSDKPPFPFTKASNGAYLNAPYPSGVLSFDPLMQDYYIKVLNAAQEIDPSTTISNDTGMVVITSKNKSIMLTGGLYVEFTQGLATVEHQLAREGIMLPTPTPKPNVDPNPLPAGPFEEPVDSGNWYRYIIFDIKVSCPPPPNVIVKPVNVKIATRDFISKKLGEQPPKLDETVAFAAEVLGFMDKL